MWKKVVFNLFQRHMINVYIINTKTSSDRPLKTILRFLEDINDALAKEFKDAERFQRRPTLQKMEGLLYLLMTDTWEVDKAGAALSEPVVEGESTSAV